MEIEEFIIKNINDLYENYAKLNNVYKNLDKIIIKKKKILDKNYKLNKDQILDLLENYVKNLKIYNKNYFINKLVFNNVLKKEFFFKIDSNNTGAKGVIINDLEKNIYSKLIKILNDNEFRKITFLVLNNEINIGEEDIYKYVIYDIIDECIDKEEKDLKILFNDNIFNNLINKEYIIKNLNNLSKIFRFISSKINEICIFDEIKIIKDKKLKKYNEVKFIIDNYVKELEKTQVFKKDDIEKLNIDKLREIV